MRIRSLFVLLVAGFLASAALGCSDDDSTGTNNVNINENVCVVDGFCDEAAGENRINCCDDCCPTCDLQDGTAYDYVINELLVPDNTHDDIGVDLDGDGTIDNRLGDILGIIPSGEFNANESIAGAIEDGSFLLLGRLIVNSFPDDDAMAFQIFLGDPTADATEDNLTGTGSAAIHEDSPRDLHLCGTVNSGYMDAGPDTLQIAISLEDVNLTVTLDRAMAISEDEVTEDDWSSVMIGGGISRQSLETELIPVLLNLLNGMIIDDPDGDLAETVLDMADGLNCDSSIPGCEAVVAGEGECAEWDGDPNNPPITVTEAMCNALLAAVLEPDVDFDGDGEDDHISLGIEVSAIPITITN